MKTLPATISRAAEPGFARGGTRPVASGCLANFTDTPDGTALWSDTERYAVQ